MKCRVSARISFVVIAFTALILLVYELRWMIMHSSPKVESGKPLTHLPRVYVYQWESFVTSRWPNAYTHHRLSTLAKYRLNGGAGPIEDANNGLHSTHQYSLYSILLSRLISSTMLTMNENEADLFLIPYDIGMDASTRQDDGALAATNCPALPRVLALLRSSKHFLRRNGSDHILIHSINQPMTFFVNRHCRPLYDLCFNCIKLSIDTYSLETYPFLASIPSMTHNWQSIPFPSNYHMSKDVVTPPWKRVLRAEPAIFLSTYQLQRPFRLCFVGTKEVTAKRQRQLRETILTLCKLRLDKDNGCLVHEIGSHESNTPFLINNRNPYEQCRLCLTPGGDFPTRKGFFDAMLSGCIPVTFQLESAQLQWPLHWGSLDRAMNATVYMPQQRLLGSETQAEQALRELILMAENMTFVHAKLLGIARVGDAMQYNLPGDHVAATSTRDAFEVIMDSLGKSLPFIGASDPLRANSAS